jgi:hypothetical protein
VAIFAGCVDIVPLEHCHSEEQVSPKKADPHPTLAYKYFGSFTEERVGTLAYRLKLPPDNGIHPVFHVSRLKSFIHDCAPGFSELPRIPHLTATSLTPVAILDRRMMKEGQRSGRPTSAPFDYRTGPSSSMGYAAS